MSVLPPLGPTREQVQDFCPRDEHDWRVASVTTFCGYESTALTCKHCPQYGYRIKEIAKRG